MSSDPVSHARSCQVPQLDAHQKPTTMSNDFSLQATPLSSSLPLTNLAPCPSARQTRSFGKSSPPPRKGWLLAFGTGTNARPSPQRGNHGNSLPDITHGHRMMTVLRQQPKLIVRSVQFNSLPSISTTISNAIQR